MIIRYLAPLMVFGAFVMGLAALILLSTSSKYRIRTGLPRGRVIYNDAAGLAEGVLYSPRYGLKGKPDYLIKDYMGRVIPIEVKSRNIPRSGQPYDSHMLQLGAYFLLVEDVLLKTPPYGLIRYNDETVEVSNSPELRDWVLDVMDEMNETLYDQYAERSHDQAARCNHCSMAYACDERLS